MIQDTSFIIDLLRGDENAKQLLDVIEKEAQPQLVSSVTVLELYEGVARSQTPETKRERILEVLETKHVVSADHAVMRRVGKLSGDSIDDGERIKREDCIIAATDILNDESIVTNFRTNTARLIGQCRREI